MVRINRMYASDLAVAVTLCATRTDPSLAAVPNGKYADFGVYKACKRAVYCKASSGIS